MSALRMLSEGATADTISMLYSGVYSYIHDCHVIESAHPPDAPSKRSSARLCHRRKTNEHNVESPRGVRHLKHISIPEKVTPINGPPSQKTLLSAG